MNLKTGDRVREKPLTPPSAGTVVEMSHYGGEPAAVVEWDDEPGVRYMFIDGEIEKVSE